MLVKSDRIVISVLHPLNFSLMAGEGGSRSTECRQLFDIFGALSHTAAESLTVS